MRFDNTYTKLPTRFYAKSQPDMPSAPKLIIFNNTLASQLELGLSDTKDREYILKTFSGTEMPKGAASIAQAYAGHQFGHFNPALGDGRATLMGEILTSKNKRYDIQLKGSGKTPFSRRGDGKSSLGPVIREYLVSEAMFHLGIPTTRALAAIETGDTVQRETALPGGVFTRVAKGHIRVGTFQYFLGCEDIDGLKELLDYTAHRHYPETIKTKTPYLSFYQAVIEKQIELITDWMAVGFIHGVMNTDNTSITGETIDFGPCAFMDYFNFNQVYSYIDHKGRYSYLNQTKIIQWNMARLGDCLVPFIHNDSKKAIETLSFELSKMEDKIMLKWHSKVANKMALTFDPKEHSEFIENWLHYLNSEKLDYTQSFLNLSLVHQKQSSEFFAPTENFKKLSLKWLELLALEDRSELEVQRHLEKVNPQIIPRNHIIEEIIQDAIKGDYKLFYEFYNALQTPFEAPEKKSFIQAPTKEQIILNTFCGT